jgi:hypothetical protein
LADIELMTRLFLAESNKYLDYSRNLNLEWVQDEDGGSFSIQARVVCQVSEEFTWFVRYNPRVASRVHTGVFFEERQAVYRLDTNDSHKNPGERTRAGTHLHRPWTHASGDSIADFLDDVPAGVWPAVNWFLERAKIVEIPEDYWSELPLAVPSNSLIKGR